MLYTQDYHLQKKLSPKDPLCTAPIGNSAIFQTKGTEDITTLSHKPNSHGGALLQ